MTRHIVSFDRRRDFQEILRHKFPPRLSCLANTHTIVTLRRIETTILMDISELCKLMEKIYLLFFILVLTLPQFLDGRDLRFVEHHRATRKNSKEVNIAHKAINSVAKVSENICDETFCQNQGSKSFVNNKALKRKHRPLYSRSIVQKLCCFLAH